MQILITGGTGFIGEKLVRALRDQNHELVILSRNEHPDDQPGVRYITDLRQLADEAPIGAVVNLAGASMAGARWSEAYKQQLLDSRIETTKAVVDLIERLEVKPEVLVSASAIGYYGAADDTPLDEQVQAGDGFAAELCRAWEAQAQRVSEAGVRVCLARHLC